MPKPMLSVVLTLINLFMMTFSGNKQKNELKWYTDKNIIGYQPVPYRAHHDRNRPVP